MRLDLLESGRFSTVHPNSALLQRCRFKVPPIALQDAAGPIACTTLSRRPLIGSAKSMPWLRVAMTAASTMN